MNTELNFSNNYYKNIACNKNNNLYYSNRTSADAFLLCIKNLPIEDLENLCLEIQNYFGTMENPIILSINECYKLTQGNPISLIIPDENFKSTLLDLAYKCIHSGKHLGNKTIADGKINTSSWISHSLFQGETCGLLAESFGLDYDTAIKLGILHDIGRKYTHTFEHTIKGFEALVDEGWLEESFGCLTHSFLGDIKENGKINGGRCANCDPALDGFYVDEQGNPKWTDDAIKDDITLFLENYNYNNYDLLLNLADLMATDKGIVSPYDRVSDIATRKIPDPKNRNYFKANFINLMRYFLKEKFNISFNKVRASYNVSNDEIDSIFIDISNLFFTSFIKNNQKNIEKISKKI